MTPAKEEVLVEKSRIQVPYKWSTGLTGARFLRTLRDERRFVGSRCPGCRKVFIPPAKTCGRCFQDCEEGVEVGPAGVLVSFTQSLYDSAVHPREKPVYGLIRLDGADTTVLHLLGVDDTDGLRIGMKVEPVFLDDGELKNLGIKHFRPI